MIPTKINNLSQENELRLIRVLQLQVASHRETGLRHYLRCEPKRDGKRGVTGLAFGGGACGCADRFDVEQAVQLFAGNPSDFGKTLAQHHAQQRRGDLFEQRFRALQQRSAAFFLA